jgi:hypothetical protein
LQSSGKIVLLFNSNYGVGEMRKILFTLAILCSVNTALANEQTANDQQKLAENSQNIKASKKPGSGPNPFSDCGIGAALFPTTPALAVSSNIIWDLGTTAITSGISSPQTCNGSRVKTAKLILETLPELEKDIASGSGEYLTALSQIMQCDANAAALLNSNLRTSYSSILAEADYTYKSNLERSSDMYNTIRTLDANGCRVVL